MGILLDLCLLVIRDKDPEATANWELLNLMERDPEFEQKYQEFQ
jgi:hypothetical protein